MFKAYWHLILKKPRFLIGAFILLFLFSVALLAHARFNFAFEPENVLNEEEYSRLIGGAREKPHETLTLILSDLTGGRVDREFLGSLTEDLSSLPQVRYAVSDASLHDPVRTDFFRMEDGMDILLIELAQAGYLSIAESRAVMHELGRTVEAKLKGTGVAYDFVGTSTTRVALHDAFRRDVLLVTIPLAIIILLLPYFLYRSWSYVILPGIAGLVTVTISLSLYGWLGENFTYFSLTLAPLIICLTLMDAMYLVDRFWSRAGMREEKGVRLMHAVGEIVFPCALTTATTATGFASLAVISDTPILREYGLFAAVGIVLALIVVFLLIPSILVFWPDPNRSFIERSEGVGRRIARLAVVASMKRRWIISAAVVLLLASIIFIPRLSVEGSFENFFSKDHRVQRGLDSLEKHLGSLVPIVFTVRSNEPEKSSRLRYLMFTGHLESWLGDQSFVKRTLSPLALIKRDGFDRIPGETVFQLRDRIERSLAQLHLPEVAALSGGWISTGSDGEFESLKIVAWPEKLDERGYEEMIRYLDNFNHTMMAEFRFEKGGPYFIQKTVESRFLREVLHSLLFSGVIVLLMTIVPLRSFKLSAIFVAINVIPLVSVAGLMGLTGTPFTLALIGLPCILFGIIVDDSIHTLWSYKKTGSIEETYLKKGRAILITSVLLVVAFGGQVFSIYTTNRQFGELAAVGIILAFLADLLLAPALLRVLHPGRR